MPEKFLSPGFRWGEKLPNVAESEQSFVTLKVGPQHKIFLVHKDMICGKSEFFNRAFQSNFKEGKEQVMVLEDTDEEVFKVVMQYLYTDRLPDTTGLDNEWRDKVKIDDKGNKELEWDFVMSSAFVFATIYEISSLSRRVEGAFCARFSTCLATATTRNYPGMATIIRVFNSVSEDCELCKLFLERFSLYWKPDANDIIDKQLFQQLPLNFTLLAMEALAKCRDQIQSQLDSPKEGPSHPVPDPPRSFFGGGSAGSLSVPYIHTGASQTPEKSPFGAGFKSSIHTGASLTPEKSPFSGTGFSTTRSQATTARPAFIIGSGPFGT